MKKIDVEAAVEAIRKAWAELPSESVNSNPSRVMAARAVEAQVEFARWALTEASSMNREDDQRQVELVFAVAQVISSMACGVLSVFPRSRAVVIAQALDDAFHQNLQMHLDGTLETIVVKLPD